MQLFQAIKNSNYRRGGWLTAEGYLLVAISIRLERDSPLHRKLLQDKLVAFYEEAIQHNAVPLP